MSEPDPGAVATVSPPVAGEPAPAGEARPVTATEAPVAPGKRWRAYQIGEPVAGASAGTFHAVEAGSMENVVVRVAPITAATEWRRGAWERLRELKHEKLVGSIEAHEENGERIEVTRVPTLPSLREWISCHQGGPDAVRQLVQQIAPLLGALHEQGILHLNLRPESIYVSETGEAMEFFLGGLHEATLYTQPKFLVAHPDPYYAPPEAMEAAPHRVGTGLCKWDWWSLGRVVQEFFLGRHVLSLVLNRDLACNMAEFRPKAEALLLEKEPPGFRAGAVEAMGKIDPMVKLLVRGLLAGSRDGRWGMDEVNRWLRREPVKDRYELPRHERMYVWKDRAMSLTEAADYFTQKARWAEGEENLFAADDPATLLHFLRSLPQHRNVAEHLQRVTALVEAPEWADVPEAARRTAVAGVCWMMLASIEKPGTLRIRGQRLDGAGLRTLLEAMPADQAVNLLRALLAPAIVEEVARFDLEAGRTLASLASVSAQALEQAQAQGWLTATDAAARLQVFLLALETEAALQERRRQLRADYARNRDSVIEGYFTAEDAEPWMLVLVAWTGARANDFGYVTHAEWSLSRYIVLREKADQVTAGIFWLRLARVLQVGAVVLAPWPICAGVWLALIGFAHWVLDSGPAALGVVAAAVGLRVLFWWRVRSLVARRESLVASWSWRDGRARCREEIARLGSAASANVRAGEEQLRAIQAEIDELPLSERPAKRLVPPRLYDLWTIAMAGTVAAIVMLIPLRQRVAPSPVETAPPPPSDAAPAAIAAATAEPEAEAIVTPVEATGPARPSHPHEYEEVFDGFVRRTRGPLPAWDLLAPEQVAALPVRDLARATPEQAAHGLIGAELVLRPYARRAVQALIAVRVPAGPHSAVVVVDSRQRQLADPHVYLLHEELRDRTWYQLGRRRVVFLAPPSPEISLAPP